MQSSIDTGRLIIDVASTSFRSELICSLKKQNSNKMRALEFFGFKHYSTGPGDHQVDAPDGMSESMLSSGILETRNYYGNYTY